MTLGCSILWKHRSVPSTAGFRYFTIPRGYFKTLEKGRERDFDGGIVEISNSPRRWAISQNAEEISKTRNPRDVDQSSSLHRDAMLTSRNSLNYASHAIDFFTHPAVTFSCAIHSLRRERAHRRESAPWINPAKRPIRSRGAVRERKNLAKTLVTLASISMQIKRDRIRSR